MSITIPAREVVEVVPSTSSVYVDGRRVGFISHPDDRPEKVGRYAKSHIAYVFGEETESEFFDTADDAAQFIASHARADA